MQLKDLVKPISTMTDEELMERLREIRHRRSVERPAARARVERAEKRQTNRKLGALDKMLAGLSDAERQQLLSQLEG